MLALLMTFLGTSNVSAGWIQKFVDQGVTADFNILFVDGSDVTIDKVTFAPIYHNDGTTDWYFNSNFLIQKDTKWLIRPGGLYQFNGGNRKFAAAVTKGQVITIEASGDPAPVSNCTVKSQSGTTYTYTATDDGYAVFNPARYLYFYKISVEDPSADEVSYTVKYMCGTTEVKPSTTGSGKPGDPITLSDTEKQNYYTSDNTAGYIYESDDSGSKTIAADGSTVVTVSFRKAKVMTCKIKAMIDDAVADEMTCGDFEGKTTSVSYHQFILKDGRLYEAADENKEYNLHFVMDGTDQEIEYNPTSFTNVVYFSEAEDISGMRWSESANANIRCSFGAGAYNDGEAPVHAATLPAGIYRISAQVWGNTGETLKVELGENVLACETTGSRVAYIAEFTINEETDLMIPVCGSSSKMLDWIFVQKMGDVEPAKDLYIMGSGTPYGWDNTTPMTLNTETNAYEYELTLTGMSYFAIGDAAFTDWDDFNTHRYGIGGGNTVAPIDTPTQLDKYADGTLVIETAGVYKVSVTKDMVMTITKTADVTATVDKVQIKGATDSEWSNQITVDLTEGEENVYTGVLDPAGSTNDVEFKLVVNDGSWIGYNELTLDAPDGWVVAQSGDKSNFVLKNADTGFKNYTVTATWVPNADFVTNWTLKIEGKDKNATEPEVVDITVEPAGGSDIYEAYAAKVKEVTDAGNVVGNITINLGGGNFTISNTIVASKNITIERKSGPSCTIDASGLSGNMIEMVVVENPEEWTKADVKIAGIMVKGLQKALFYSAGKNYVAENFTINDCVIEQAADASTIDYTKGSTALNLTITNSTFFAPTATTKSFYSSQSGQRPTDYDASATQTFTFKNNTMYNLAYGKNFFTNRSNGQKWMTFDIEQNIFVNCGKSGQVVKGFNGGQASANPTWTVSGNLFNYDGADTSASESTGDDAEPVQDSVEGVVTFNYPSAPLFSGTVLLSPSATEPSALGDPRWTLTYGKALAINITESEGGKVTASPSAAAEGMTVTLTATPDEGYELESLTVKDGADAEVTVNEDNTFTMPATDVTVTATFKKLPVDVNITVESGKDIAEAVEAAADGAPVKSITVTLEEGGTYTISKSLSAQGNVIINGNGATIDASALTTPFVQMADLPTEGLNDKGAYEIDEVSFNDVTITGLPYQLFYANKQKYLITTLKVDNSVIGINGSKNKTIFDFNGGGNCLNLTVNNSTLWANPSNAQNGGFYSSQSGQSVQDLKDGAEQVTTISNSTIYNIASGKTTSTRRKNSQDWIKYVVKNSIIAESGKSGQFLKGLNAGQAGKDAEWTVDGNTFIFGGAVIEEQAVGSTAENIQNSLTSDPEFADAASGDFTVGESTEQAELETGDPRWLVEFVGGEGDATDLLAEIEEAKKLLKYSMPYYDENNEESPETEGKALVDAIRDAEEKAEGGTSQKKLDKMLEDLKQAEIDYTTALMDYELAESEAILAGADPADELAAEIQRLYDTQDVVREDYSNQPKHIKNYADEIDKAQKAYLRKAINELIPEAQAMASDPAVQNALDKANEALEGDSSEDLFDALNGLLEAMETATGIRGIEANDTDDAPVYNMGGQRVSSNAKGIVIKNGKKIIRK